jgi:hypothetical protein
MLTIILTLVFILILTIIGVVIYDVFYIEGNPHENKLNQMIKLGYNNKDSDDYYSFIIFLIYLENSGYDKLLESNNLSQYIEEY